MKIEDWGLRIEYETGRGRVHPRGSIGVTVSVGLVWGVAESRTVALCCSLCFSHFPAIGYAEKQNRRFAPHTYALSGPNTNPATESVKTVPRSRSKLFVLNFSGNFFERKF